MIDLSSHALVLLVFAALVFTVFVWDRFPIATVSLGVLALLPLGFSAFPLQTADGPVDPLRFFAGFGNPALIAICSLMIVGHALVVTGALEPTARVLARVVARHPRSALLAVLVLAAAVSGVVNDTPVVVLMIPLLLAAAKQAKTSAAGMLMPMNFAVLIGGMGTTIGTSTNLIVVAIAASLGVTTLSMFSFFGLVAMAAVPALLYLWLVAPRLLAKVQSPQENLSEDVFDAAIHVTEDSALEGKALSEVLAKGDGAFPLVALMRRGVSQVRLPSMKLKVGDRLVLRATADRLKAVEQALDTPLHRVAESEEDDQEDKAGTEEEKQDKDKDKEAAPSAVVAQLIVTPDSPLVGRSVRQERMAARFDIIVVGLRRANQSSMSEREDLTDLTLSAGDVLLVQGQIDDMRDAQRKGMGLLLDERLALPRQDKAALALVVMAGVVLLSATKTLPIALAALAGALVLLFARCLTWQDVGQSLSTKVILLVSASLALGDAMQITGATEWMALGLAELTRSLSPAWVAALLMGLMGFVTNFVSNNAAAAIGTPLAISLAAALGVPPEPFVLAVLFGCNLCYLTPMGYQTNLLVMNAGGYSFGDFLRVGTPLFLIMWGSLSWLLAWRYGL